MRKVGDLEQIEYILEKTYGSLYNDLLSFLFCSTKISIESTHLQDALNDLKERALGIQTGMFSLWERVKSQQDPTKSRPSISKQSLDFTLSTLLFGMSKSSTVSCDDEKSVLEFKNQFLDRFGNF
jgi:hypothetical protein